jgi:phosphohistidine phosphatase
VISDVRLVYLLRHAKSDWGDESLPDAARPLSGRGRRSAAEVAQTLGTQSIRPDVVLVSSAARTRETVAAFADALPDGVDVRYEDELYAAEATTLLGRLRTLPDDARSVMLVGHNPGIEQLAAGLARPATAEALMDGMRTATLVALALPAARWADVAPATADLVGRWQHRGEKG